MDDRSRAALERRLPLLALAVLTYGLAFLQRPGEIVAETRIELSADPGLFLERVAYVWSATVDFGHVHAGNFGGYLAPMGPYFAGGDAIGVPMWILQRFWLGSLLFISGWGVMKLMGALLPRRNVVAECAAAVVFVLTPYVVLYTSRGTVTLVAYAALPWLVLAVHMGLRERRGWRWPAVVGLIMALTQGGVNAAVIAFALIGPIGLMAYELLLGAVTRRDAWSFAWRCGVTGALGAAWWAVPLALQSRYGEPFLLFTEHARTIWGTTSLSELLRGLGFWSLYTGVGFGGLEPFMAIADTYLFNPVVIVATFGVPLFAFATLRATRGWRYAPFFVLLGVLSLVMMFAGFPEGTRLRALLLDLYDKSGTLQILRTTYKAAPLLSLSLACLSGAGVAALVARARDGRLSIGRRRVPPWALAGLVLIPALAALPLVDGSAIDQRQVYGSVPAAWPAALQDADRAQPPATRTMVLPGELFGWYRWGGTSDSIAPTISRRPVAIREIVPYADDRSSQLQIAVDDLIQQGRLVPGQLAPLLRMLDVAQVLVAADGRLPRNGALDPVAVERAISGQPGLERVRQAYGERHTYSPERGRGGRPLRIPDIHRLAVKGVGGPGGVRLQPTERPTVLEGDAEGIPELAAMGLLEPRRALFYAGDVEGQRMREAVDSNARLVLTDSARRRSYTAPRLRGNRGPTLGPNDPLSADAPIFEPFPERGNAGRTVALYTGVRRIYSPAQPGFQQFPQYRAYSAMDGRLDTSWLADENLRPERWYLHVDLARPLRVASIGIVPHATRLGRTEAIQLSVNGGPGRRVELRPGMNRVPIDAPKLRSLNLQIAKITGDVDRRGAGGIAELEVPGVRVRERLRLPTAMTDDLRGVDLSHNDFVVALARTTADFPYTAGADTGEPEDRSAVAMVDAESGLERQLSLPAARRFSPSGWASVGPAAPDSAIDSLVGAPPDWRLDSSSRFEGVPGRRASSAFDGDARTAWVGDWAKGRTAFLAFRAPTPVRLDRLRLRAGPAEYAFPSRVRVIAPGAPPVTAAVSPTGRVQLPQPLRTRSARIAVVAVRHRTPAGARRGLRAVAIAEVTAPGLVPPAPRRSGRFATACGELNLAAGTRRTRMAVAGTVAALDAGRPLRLRGCGGALSLPAGVSRLSAPAGAVMRPDHLELSSPAPRPRGVAAAASGRVTSVGLDGPPGAPASAELAVRAPSWLVLEQSYNKGWRAWCTDSSGSEHSLGGSQAIDGYANGWRVGPDCSRARFAFTPQRTATVAYAISALACLGMLGILLVGTLRRRRAARVRAGGPDDTPALLGRMPSLPPDPLIRPGWKATLGVTAAVAVVGGGLFALRMGVVLGLLALVLLRKGVNVGRLVAIAGVLLAALPMLYLLFPAEDRGGFSFEYPNDELKAHWVAVVAIACLAAAGGLAAWRLRRPTSPEGPPPPDDGGEVGEDEPERAAAGVA